MPPNPAPMIAIFMNSPGLWSQGACSRKVASEPADSILFFCTSFQLSSKDFEPAPHLADHIDHCQVLQPARIALRIFRKLFEDFNRLVVGPSGFGILARQLLQISLIPFTQLFSLSQALTYFFDTLIHAPDGYLQLFHSKGFD